LANPSIAHRQNSASGVAWMPLAVVNTTELRPRPVRTSNCPIPALVA
jgi:hypothetical protein